MSFLIKKIFVWFFLIGISFSALSNEININIPEISSMNLHSPDDYKSLVSFEGKEDLEGSIFALSETIEVDGEKESRLRFFFKPSSKFIKKLPIVKFKTEKINTSDIVIELDFFQKDKIKSSITTIFGDDAINSMSNSNNIFAKNGIITIDNFRTGVECDKRYYYATLLSFESESNLIEQKQAKKLIENNKKSCF